MQKFELRQGEDNIHNNKWKMKLVLIRIKKELSKENQKLIHRYHEEMIIHSLAISTQVKQLETILSLSKILKKDWKDAKKGDVRRVALQISLRFCDEEGKETFYSYDHKKMLKIFFRWLKFGSRNYKEVGDPPETKRIRLRIVFNKIARKDLITEEDRQKLLDACIGNLRDRAFIDCHLEAGTRPGEILSLHIHHVKFDKFGAIIQVSGKTGTRIVRLIKSTPSLASWLNVHPFKEDYDAPLWINMGKQRFGDSLSYAAASSMVKRRARNAKIKKKINLNLFRHSAATDAANYLTDAQMRERHGWSSYSKVPGRYVHLTHKDVDNAMLQFYGLTKRNKKKNLPITCHICETQNHPSQEICWKCGKALSLKSLLKISKKQIFETFSKNLSISYYLS